MAIIYPLSMPTVKTLKSIRLQAKNVVAISQSPFTLKQQVVSHTGQCWSADITLPPLTRAQAEEWLSFLISLKGQKGTFLMGDPSGATARGSASTTAGTPLVNGASQTGDNLAIDGLPTSVSGYLKAGDYIQLGTGSGATLHKVLTDTDTNSSGEANIDIFPSLRTSPADDAAVTVSNAKGVFRLATSDVNWTVDEVVHFGLSFSCVEAIS